MSTFDRLLLLLLPVSPFIVFLLAKVGVWLWELVMAARAKDFERVSREADGFCEKYARDLKLKNKL